MKYKNVWFINFSGIGNGIMISPILKCFDNSFPKVNYFHTYNEILADDILIKQSGLTNLKGLSPIAWRRFEKKYWLNIEKFITKNNIDLIINLRNEGPKYNLGYYEFKTVYQSRFKVKFWELDFVKIERRKRPANLAADILGLLKNNGLDDKFYCPYWLKPELGFRKKNKGIGFGMAASQQNKRWPSDKWADLAKVVLSENDVILFPGISETEIRAALQVQQQVNSIHCQLFKNSNIHEVISALQSLQGFVSNDTALLHIAAAIGIPTIGVYISTNADIWSPYNKDNFLPFSNTFFKFCPDPKIHCGNCFHYYDICPAIAEYGDDIKPEAVFKALSEMLG